MSEDLETRLDELEADVEQMETLLRRVNGRLKKLSEDFTDLRYELNEVEDKLDRRT